MDINQPGEFSDAGFYQDGPVIGRISRGAGDVPVGLDPVSVLVDEGTSVEVPVTVFSNTAVPVILTGGVQARVANCRSFPLCPASQVLSFQIHNPQIAASCP